MPSLAYGVIKGVADRDQQFFQAIRSEDDLGRVIRSHIHLEHELREFIRAKAPAPDQYVESEFSYSRTVRLALILGLSDNLRSGLYYVGSLRNRFAHRLDVTLGEKDADDFHDVLSEHMRKFVTANYENFKAGSEWPTDFKQFSPGDRISFIIICLRAAVLGEHMIALKPELVRGDVQQGG